MAGKAEFVIQFGCLTAYNGKEKDVVIPDGVTVIGRRAFYFNKEIETVTIPESVDTVEQEAFQYCTALHTITILGTIKKAGKYAFGSFFQQEALELSVYSAVPIRAFAKSAQDAVLRVFSGRFCEFDPNTAVFRDNLQFLGTHLKQPREYSNKLFCHYLAENDALRHAVLDAGAIPAKDLDWLEVALQSEADAAITAELLEYKNRLLSDEKARRSLVKAKERAVQKELSPELSVADWRKLYSFSYENGAVVIKKVKVREPVITIPEQIGARKVRVIDSFAFEYCLQPGETQLWSPERILIPEGVDEIRGTAFYCAKNTEIFFPSTLKALPPDCFCAVENLTLHIPASVTEIPDELEYDSGEPAFKAIHAPAGSCAEQYAKENNIPFVAE